MCAGTKYLLYKKRQILLGHPVYIYVVDYNELINQTKVQFSGANSIFLPGKLDLTKTRYWVRFLQVTFLIQAMD